MPRAIETRPVPSISPLAGRPAPKEMLVVVAQLERGYFERRPDLSDPNHREAAKSAKSAKISRRKILSCQQRIFGLVVQDRSSFVTWPGRPCHDAIVARVSRRG